MMIQAIVITRIPFKHSIPFGVDVVFISFIVFDIIENVGRIWLFVSETLKSN